MFRRSQIDAATARRSRHRGFSALVVGGLALALTACGGAPLPASVVPDSEVSVAWPGSLTTLNAATASGVAPGDLDVAELTRSQFATEVDGTVTTHTTFGDVEILTQEDDRFAVRYDLAEPSWSDGIPLDAADLLLAWAAGADAGDAGFDSARTGLAHSTAAPTHDEFERRIEVSFDRPVHDWQTALDVAVPAHVAGQIAFGLDDPMVAKQAVIDAVEDGSAGELKKLARAWNDGFDLADGAAPARATAISSGPYRIESATGSAKNGEQRVALEVNPTFVGEIPTVYHHIVLQQDRADDLVDRVGADYDVVQLPVTEADFTQVRDLERDDFGKAEGSNGQMWGLYARADSAKMGDQAARTAFFQSVRTGDVITAAGGAWEQAYVPTSAAVFVPGSDDYDIALEDSGFAAAFTAEGKPSEIREAAGIPTHTSLCLLYDSDSAFASAAFDAIRAGSAEAGWVVRDCGNSSPQDVVEAGGEYDLALLRSDIAVTPDELAQQWSDESGNPTRATSDERDELIDQLARTTDPYEARDIRVAIEQTIVDQRIALPLAMDAVVLVSSRDTDAVTVDPGATGALLSDPRAWVPAGSDPIGP